MARGNVELAPDEFRCAQCGEVFKRGRSEEEAREEARSLWGNLQPEQEAVVCDTCFRRLTGEPVETV